jgi:hypothetical protein
MKYGYYIYINYIFWAVYELISILIWFRNSMKNNEIWRSIEDIIYKRAGTDIFSTEKKYLVHCRYMLNISNKEMTVGLRM